MKYTLLVNKNTQQRSVRNNKTGEVVQEALEPEKYNELRRKAITNFKQAQRNEVYADLGLTKVKGAVSGKTYWE